MVYQHLELWRPMKFKSLLLIIILASLLRIWNLNNFPVGFNADEAAIGYNAYSLLQTGKDEYGSSFPLTFKSFGDYKPGLYFYFVLPFVATLGLNEWAVRLPSALLGIGTVILIFFLGKKLFNVKVGLLSSLLLAIYPWHIHFSRGGWETNAATFFITLGVYLYIKGLKNYQMLFYSFVSFLVSMYIYQSPRLVVPILLLTFIVLSYSEFVLLLSVKKIKKYSILIILLLVLTIPLAYQLISGQGSARFNGLSFLSDTGPTSRVNNLRGEHDNPGNSSAKILHNKLTAYGPEFLGHYLDHFKPDFLFITGDPLIRNKVPEVGQFYLIEALLLLFGLIYLCKNRFEYIKLIIAWVFIAPIASAMTYQTPHALRALNLVIPLTLIMALGLSVFFSKFNKFKIITTVILIIVFSFEFTHYIESYYVHYPKRYPLAWEYGFKEMVNKVSLYESKYDKVVITDRYDQPYILVLFYKKFDPKKYQPQAQLTERDKFNFGTIREFDKFQFRAIDPAEIDKSPKTLFVATTQEVPKDANILDMIRFPNNEPAFIFVEAK